MTESRPLESYLYRPATGDQRNGEEKEDEEERVRRDLIRPGQPVFDMVAELVARLDVGALQLLYSGFTPLHEILAQDTDFRRDEGFAARTGAPFRTEDNAGTHAARALGGVGLALAAPESAQQALHSALAWYADACSSVAAPGWDLRDIAEAEPQLRPLAELPVPAREDERRAAGALTVAVTLRALDATSRKHTRRSGVTVLLAGRSKDNTDGIQGQLQMSAAAGLPPGLVADPGHMALFTADLTFLVSLDRAWAQAGARRGGRAVLWSVRESEGPVPYIEGESAGAAFAVVLDEARRLSGPLAGARVIRRLKADNAIVGKIDDLGYLQSVEGYDSKLNALDDHTRVIVPAVDKQKAQDAAKDDKGLKIIAAADWKQAARLARRANVKVVLLQVVAVALAIAVGISTYAWLQHNRAVSETFAADSGTLIDQSQKTGATDPALARLEAVAAWNLDQTPDAGYAMLKAASLPPYAVLDDDGTADGPMTFSEDSRLLAVGLQHNRIKIWNTATHQLTTTLTGGDQYDALTGFTFSPDGSRLAAGADTKIELWDVSSRKLTTLETNGSIMDITYSRDGAFIAAVTDNAGVQVWDVNTGRLTRTFPESSPGQDNGAVAFSPDGRLLAVGAQDGAQLWDLDTGQLVTTLTAGASDFVTSVAFSPDGRELAAGGVGVRIWNLSTRQSMKTLQFGSDDDLAGGMAFSSDGSRLAIGTSSDGEQLWNVASGQRIARFTYGESLVVSPDFSLAAFTTQKGTLGLLNVAAESVLDSPAAVLPSADPDDVSSIAFSPNGHLLAAGTDGVGGGGDGGVGHGIRLWNVTTHDLVATLEASNRAPVISVAFSPDNSLLAAGTYGDGTQIWNVATRRLVTTLKLGQGNQVSEVAGNRVSALAFSGQGMLAVGTDGGGLQLWDIATGQLVATLSHGPYNVSAVAFSPNGGLLVVGTTGVGLNMGMGHVGGGVQVWNPATHELVTSLVPGTTNQVYTVAFSRAGSLLASTRDGMRVWNASSLQLTTSVGSSTGLAAFSQDGTVAAIPATSGIQLWDTPTGQQASTVPDDDAAGMPAAFSPDDTLLAVGANDGSVQLWKVPYVAGTAGYLCSVAGESFPPAVWAQYASGIAYQKTCS